ncbi:ABC transporter permease [Phytohabitans kaempferiae]|uniref:ABC transporter permease n=1 Tax=Phytohabitans kaempferiae TaxID=1620943 RepID=A0ABV6LZ53_9ACTN
MSEVVAEVRPEPVAPPPVRPPRRRGVAVAAGAALLVAGAVLLWVALVPAGGLGNLLKLLLVLAAIGLAGQGVRRIGAGIRGGEFDAGFWLSIAWLAGLAAAAALADLLPLGNATDTTQTIGQAGYATPDLLSAHPLGTNGFGLDLLARSVYGARVSLLTVGLTVAVSLLVGGTIGMVAGYFRRSVDLVIGVFADAALVIPALVLLIAFAAVLGPPTTVGEAVLKNGLALAVVGIPTMIRLARANTMVYAQREFVLASRAMGAKHLRVLRREILPNVALPLVSYAFIVAAVLIVAEGSLAFLGLGLQQPEPSWGNMVAEGGLRELRQHPHVPLVPGAFMFLTVYSLNVVGERARARWDSREVKV